METIVKKSAYYHVSSRENFYKILNEGIKANEDGEIFLFDTEFVLNPCFDPLKPESGAKVIDVAASIARNQVFLHEFIVVEIDAEGITGELINDKVGEFTAPLQWIVKQQVIEADFICEWWDESETSNRLDNYEFFIEGKWVQLSNS